MNTEKDKIEYYNNSELQYISFSKKITILLNNIDKKKEDFKKNIYSFSLIDELVNKIKKVLEK